MVLSKVVAAVTFYVMVTAVEWPPHPITKNIRLQKLCAIAYQIQTPTAAAESSEFVTNASNMNSQFLANKTTSNKPSGLKKATKSTIENRRCFHFCGVCHLKMNSGKLKNDKKKTRRFNHINYIYKLT
jgi:hypothetical protein